MGSTAPERQQQQQVSADDDPPFPLTAIDRQILATKDSDYHRITWSDLQRIIFTNTLQDLKRVPSDLRKYLAWSHKIKQQYGGIVPFVIQERLHWSPPIQLTTSPPTFARHSHIPFQDYRDYAVLVNDWPYGFVPGIVTHMVVWTKTPIETDDHDDEGGGDLTPASRKLVEEFVERFFVRDLLGDRGGEEARERVLWFKNWVGLQSVRGVDHVHVLVRDAPRDLVEKWTERRDYRVFPS